MERLYGVLVLFAAMRVQAAPGRMPEFCRKPPVLGICRSLNQSWHFDPQDNRCKMFSMGFCGGGGNIFPTEKNCITACMTGTKQPACWQKPIFGSCEQQHRAWYYDHRLKFCKMFMHGICGIGSNMFPTEVKCREVCEGIRQPIPICSAKPDTKLCFNLNNKWYFDEAQGICRRFDRGWCGKNANGFISSDVCLWRCSYTKSCWRCKKPIAPKIPSRPINKPSNTIQPSYAFQPPNTIQPSNTMKTSHVTQNSNTLQSFGTFQPINGIQPPNTIQSYNNPQNFNMIPRK